MRYKYLTAAVHDSYSTVLENHTPLPSTTPLAVVGFLGTKWNYCVVPLRESDLHVGDLFVFGLVRMDDGIVLQL